MARIPSLDHLVIHRLVKVPQQLTARSRSFLFSCYLHTGLISHYLQVWKNIYQPLVKYMELMKSRRLVREFTGLRSTRKRITINIPRTSKISQLPFKSVMPEPNDF